MTIALEIETPVAEVEVTEEMIDAGEEALRRWYGEPGETPHFLRRAAEEVFLAMQAASEKQGEPTS